MFDIGRVTDVSVRPSRARRTMTRAPEDDGRELDRLIERSRAGDGRAVEQLVIAIKDDVFGIAVRMLWHPEDAEDATQEILMKVVTHLGTFRGESAFGTWVYRIATNHLLTIRQSRVEREGITFAAFGEQLASGWSEPPASAASDADQALLEEEVKIGCTTGMLLCLDRDDRIAYVLGDVFELRSEDAAYALDIEPAAFRKRLSRARERLRAFMRVHCGLVSQSAPCRCARRVETAIRIGRVNPGELLFAGHPKRQARQLPVLEEVGEMEMLHTLAGVFQSHPGYAASQRVVEDVRRLLESNRFRLLS
jgi:RNA polymerase sigma factor (sigma-70 family)